jgi:RimJ/RimL family protein N-acetyltransferase
MDDVGPVLARYVAMAAGPGRADEVWRNWVVRRREDDQAVGTVQATLTRDGGRWTAAVAWVIGVPFQGRGHAGEAARAGLRATAERVDGEQVWRLSVGALQ